MSLFKRKIGRRRHVGRRIVGIGAGVALLVLGLEAPAFAVPPTATTASPTSGPPGCVVKVTGTNFENPNVTSVQFGAPGPGGVATFTIQSDTELWTTVPAAFAAGATTITVDNGSPPAAVLAFTVTAATIPGGCAPTVTSYTPTCGAAGVEVVIAGTNLLRSDAGTGGVVKFAPYPAPAFPLGGATHSNAATETPESLTVFVPTGAADGPIRVSTFNDTIGQGAALGATVFEVPPPDCAVGTVGHERAITLKLTKKGRASGVVSSTEDPPFDACVAAVPVKIQRKGKGGGWKNAGSTTTTDTGSYAKKTKGKPGKYRAIAPKVAGTTAADDCLKKTSAIRTIKK